MNDANYMRMKVIHAGMSLALAVVCVLCQYAVFAAPRLNAQAELVADGAFKAKVLAGARGVPAATPEAHYYTIKRGGETTKAKLYAPEDIWRARAYAGEWKDRKGNTMRLARVKSLVPEFERQHWYRDEIEKSLDAMEKSFAGSEEEREKWRVAWGGGAGRFISAGKPPALYYVDFEFAEKVAEADVQKLLKAFEKSVSSVVSGSNASSMKWWDVENEQYRFLTDLDRARGGKFVKDTMRLMGAMRRAYEKYVPPQKPVGKCTVRVFKTLSGYREHLSDGGSEMEWSCGLWDPSHEELLVAAEDRAQALDTMRHEAFHQYLFYATGGARHALWFNEGHACFFENVQYNPAKDSVKILDAGNRASWVAKDPEKVARALPAVMRMSRAEFYGGSREDRNLHYVASWAAVYFLEIGCYAADEFAPYRRVVAKYLELCGEGADPLDATAQALETAKGRDISADFLKFWARFRKQAQKSQRDLSQISPPR